MFASNKQFEGNIVTLNMNNALNLPKSWIRCDLHYACNNRSFDYMFMQCM